MTSSGLAYRVIAPGSSKKPSVQNDVEVRYQGKLIDGTVIDSSGNDGKTVHFPMKDVIAGWTEGLQFIGEGGKIELVVPPRLAYGDAGTQSGVAPGSTLIFQVELVKIVAR